MHNRATMQCDVECNPFCKCFSYSAVGSVGLFKSQTSFLAHVDKV